jgi:Ribonuclease G/E
VCLDKAQQTATTWSNADCRKAIEQLERKIDQVRPATCKLFDKLFQYDEQQLLQEVRTKTTGPRNIFAKELAINKAAAQDEAYGAAKMTANERLQFLIRLSNAETEATT